MYAHHYHHYTPSLQTDIMVTLRKFGFVPPSEDKAMQEKWKYYRECGWNNEKEAARGV